MEIYKDIRGFEGKYQISNYGNVKSLHFCNGKKEKILKQTICRNYLEVCLSKNNKAKSYFVHRLVAQAFIPNPLNLPEVNHKDGNKHNNKQENLEWCTRLENMRHAKEHNLIKIVRGKDHYMYHKYGSLHHNAKKIKQLDKNNNLIRVWECAIDIEREIGIKRSNICKCCKGKRKTTGGYKWEYLTEPIFDKEEKTEIEIEEIDV